jgi:hypothetical protein
MDVSYENFSDSYTLNYEIVGDSDFKKDELNCFNPYDFKNKLLEKRKDRWCIYYERCGTTLPYYYLFIDNHGEIYCRILGYNFTQDSQYFPALESNYKYRLTNEMIKNIKKKLNHSWEHSQLISPKDGGYDFSNSNLRILLDTYQKNAEDSYKIINLQYINDKLIKENNELKLMIENLNKENNTLKDKNNHLIWNLI